MAYAFVRLKMRNGAAVSSYTYVRQSVRYGLREIVGIWL
jgi:hypothetical protein